MFQKIERMDRRVVFLVLLVLISLPLFSPIGFQIKPTRESLGIYNFLEDLPAGSVVIQSYDYSPSALAELQPQADAFTFHTKQRGLKNVIIAFWAQGAALAARACRKVYGSDFPDVPEYGKDVVLIGYIPGGAVGMSAFASDTWQTKRVDYYGTDFEDLPLMSEVRDHSDFDFWISWMAGTPGAIQVVMYVWGPYKVPLGTGATAVSVPEAMPYYAAGQFKGILAGLAGAAEYENLMADDYPTEFWTPTTYPTMMDAQSLSHLVIIIFVIIGNIAFLATRQKGGRS